MTTQIEPGERVTIGPNARHAEFRGLAGTVRRYIKSRDVVEVRLDNGRFYDAHPANVTRESTP